MGYIYLVTNRLTGKQYVGQTLHEDIEIRWNQHRRVCEKSLGRHIASAYKKHGIDNFKFQVICICFDEACNDLEEYYINKFNTLTPNGYNLREGGNNSKHSEESKQLMSQNRKGKGLGYMTEEILQSRIGRFAGEKNHNFGKQLSDEQKQKISERMKQIWEEKKCIGYTSSPKLLEALAKGRQKRIDDAKLRKEQKPKSRGRNQRVAKLDEVGNILEEYESITDAANKTGANGQVISAVCRGDKKHAGGFKWKYLDIDGIHVKRNNSTGELYINKYNNGYMLRINKKEYKFSKWFKTLEEAIKQRDACIEEIESDE